MWGSGFDDMQEIDMISDANQDQQSESDASSRYVPTAAAAKPAKKDAFWGNDNYEDIEEFDQEPEIKQHSFNKRSQGSNLR